MTGLEEADPTVRFARRCDGKTVVAENLWVCLSAERPFLYAVGYPKWGLDSVGAPNEAFFMTTMALAEVATDVGLERVEATPIADVSEGAQFYIAMAKAPEFCLAVGKDADEPAKVKLAAVSADDARQKWTLEGGDGFRNVHSGEFLDTQTQYIFVGNAAGRNYVSSNGSVLRTATQNHGDSQLWMGQSPKYVSQYLVPFFDFWGCFC